MLEFEPRITGIGSDCSTNMQPPLPLREYLFLMYYGGSLVNRTLTFQWHSTFYRDKWEPSQLSFVSLLWAKLLEFEEPPVFKGES